MAKQISVSLDNKAGRLYHVTRILGDAGINIRAFSVAETSDFGILRIIVNDPDEARRILKKAGFTVSETEVIAVRVSDIPGGLASILAQMEDSDLNIEYLYAFLGAAERDVLVIFKVGDLEKACNTFTQKGIKFIDEKQLYEL